MTWRAPHAFAAFATLAQLAGLGCVASGPAGTPEATAAPGEGAAVDPPAHAAGPAPMWPPSSTDPTRMSIADDKYGRFKYAQGAPHLGERVPDFELPQADGSTYRLPTPAPAAMC